MPRRKASTDERLPRARAREDAPARGNGSAAGSSATAVAAEAMRTGVLPGRRRPLAIPHEDEILVGDPDDALLANEYVGEETPGGSTPTPDQNGVDEIGRAYGLQEEDEGPLRSAAEVLERRDRRRPELRPPRRAV